MKRKQTLKRAFADANAKTSTPFGKMRDKSGDGPRSICASLPLILGLALFVNSGARAQLATDAVHGYGINGAAQSTPQAGPDTRAKPVITPWTSA